MIKKVLALGLTREQFEGIKYAKSKELYIIGIDRNLPEDIKAYIDEYYRIDLKEEQKIVELVKNMGIAFIIPSTIGHLLTTVGAVNDALNLPGINKEWANNLTNKEIYNNLLVKKKLFTPTKKIVFKPNLDNVIELVHKVGLPCILKPAKGSGSRGVITISKENEIETAVNYSLDALFVNEKLIIEEFVSGEEFGVDFQIISGEIKVLAMRWKILTELPYRQEIGYISDNNTELILEVQKKLKVLFEEAPLKIISLGHVDMILNEKNIFFIEMSLRPAGLGITYNYLPSIIGYNPIERLIDYLKGDNLNKYSVKNSNFVGLFFWDLPMGKVSNIKRESLINVEIYKLNLEIGSEINKVRTGNDIFERGFFILEAQSKTALVKKREEVLSSITVK
ncbi:ATP-grasp domain-containing protein [Solibacillus cecembensis]|uniref:ATP-grasp domain-containing protein n=1 Tax=Solibacillus cecembensis TaxID=459347 RepID=UPI003CFE92F7